MPPLTPWKPGRREQAALWWMRLITRYGIGGGGLVWEILVDQFQHSVALFVFGVIASGTDMIGYAKALIQDESSRNHPPKDSDS